MCTKVRPEEQHRRNNDKNKAQPAEQTRTRSHIAHSHNKRHGYSNSLASDKSSSSSSSSSHTCTCSSAGGLVQSARSEEAIEIDGIAVSLDACSISPSYGVCAPLNAGVVDSEKVGGDEKAVVGIEVDADG